MTKYICSRIFLLQLNLHEIKKTNIISFVFFQFVFILDMFVRKI